MGSRSRRADANGAPSRARPGVFVRRTDVEEAGVFCVPGSRAVLCTDAVRRFLEGRGASNVAFLAAGEAV